MASKRIIGVVENVKIFGKKASITIPARIDTGASSTSIDVEVAAKLGLGKIKETRKVCA